MELTAAVKTQERPVKGREKNKKKEQRPMMEKDESSSLSPAESHRFRHFRFRSRCVCSHGALRRDPAPADLI